mgnify:CR=1 FL=1
MWTTSSLNRADSCRRLQSRIPNEEFLVFSGEDIVCDDCNIEFVAELAAECQQQCSLTGAHRPDMARSAISKPHHKYRYVCSSSPPNSYCECAFVPIAIRVIWHGSLFEFARVFHKLVRMPMFVSTHTVRVSVSRRTVGTRGFVGVRMRVTTRTGGASGGEPEIAHLALSCGHCGQDW